LFSRAQRAIVGPDDKAAIELLLAGLPNLTADRKILNVRTLSDPEDCEP
jgi:hypothetical protein